MRLLVEYGPRCYRPHTRLEREAFEGAACLPVWRGGLVGGEWDIKNRSVRAVYSGLIEGLCNNNLHNTRGATWHMARLFESIIAVVR